ncbi:MAG: helix-turn-helix domain-containing protein [Holosporaceae bacterium]|jgi:transcriptional regulator with XRE-family HTH domain|nr:helix-turn-helix domain-containing protein [Holosporaceae bacterium]
MANYSTTSKRSVQSDLDTYIGKRVKSRRSLLGISQEKLGNYLGITFQQIQKYEKGVNRISASSLYNIANVLSVDWSYFVDGYGESFQLNEEGSPVYETNHSLKKKEVEELLHHYGKIADEQIREKIVEMVKALSSTQNLG